MNLDENPTTEALCQCMRNKVTLTTFVSLAKMNELYKNKSINDEK